MTVPHIQAYVVCPTWFLFLSLHRGWRWATLRSMSREVVTSYSCCSLWLSLYMMRCVVATLGLVEVFLCTSVTVYPCSMPTFVPFSSV